MAKRCYIHIVRWEYRGEFSVSQAAAAGDFLGAAKLRDLYDDSWWNPAKAKPVEPVKTKKKKEK